ncbi:phage shock protein PspC (stress-responsive transcriptional regulator) [Dysgonomonas sp. PH5-45]|uniref:PspC domain-containing protein n=1 Tax=unclassified Dysgonomonas TaxID=2630389 RepID=UPI002474491D|nr:MULTISPECIES: PspC domain-containing protein [unclassified Dysgonomonas]MDH6356002.1 phage shock protein PspC (stress-responsive transcriptional regulator) [Dysgonomonas sp. PH5-45]MDH6388901.1 phage shock protein PspC (stress-responsive transcriptional regulator) [Dysgonomonas sp. PH5-37]
MKKVIDVNMGGISFSIEDDAYIQLKGYLSRFEKTINNPEDVKEVMEDVEIRIAEIFQKELRFPSQVVDSKLVDKVIDCLGDIEQQSAAENASSSSQEKKWQPDEEAPFMRNNRYRKLYRDSDSKKIAGVCSGIATYFDIDVTLVRIIFAVLVFCYGSTVVLYIALWIAMPVAQTVAQKLELRGVQPTAENIRRYTAMYGKS